MIKPLNDFVFVRETQPPAMSPGGIVLILKERTWSVDDQDHKEGTVVAVGPGKVGKKGVRESMWGLEPGRVVAFSPNGNFKQRIDGEELTVIRRDSVIGFLEEAAA